MEKICGDGGDEVRENSIKPEKVVVVAENCTRQESVNCEIQDGEGDADDGILTGADEGFWGFHIVYYNTSRGAGTYGIILLIKEVFYESSCYWRQWLYWFPYCY